MAYIVVKDFLDLQDNGYKYEKGKTFPREGMSVLPSRIKELASNKNRQGVPLIEEIPDEEPKKEKKTKSVEKADEE